MNEREYQELVAAVLARLVPRLGGDGRRGALLVVFCAATAGFEEAMHQVRRLVLSGYRLECLLSSAAERLYGPALEQQLAGFPHVQRGSEQSWLSLLQQAAAVVVPLLSVNTLSKVALLLADTEPSNALLHALFMGKPVVVAKDGADPTGTGRHQLGWDRGRSALMEALEERLQRLTAYGARLVAARRLCDAVSEVLDGSREGMDERLPGSVRAEHTLRLAGKVVSAAHIASAHRQGLRLVIPADAVVTPLAREWAARNAVRLVRKCGGAGGCSENRNPWLE